MELLWIEPHQPLRGMLRDSEMDLMARVARRDPRRNVQMIEGAGMTVLQRANLFGAMGLDINPTMYKLQGRMLDVPLLRYRVLISEPESQRMRDGRWDLRRKFFTVPTRLDSLCVIQISPQTVPQHVLESFSTRGLAYGMTSAAARRVHNQVSDSTSPIDLNDALEALRQSVGRRAKISIVLVLFAAQDNDGYAAIKFWGDTIAGVNTVCCTTGDKGKAGLLGNAPFQGNLALKFNVKLSGRNHSLANSAYDSINAGKKATTMIVGADVTHPSGASIKHCPSIAAVVASTDITGVYYRGSMRLQAGKVEVST